MKTPSRHLLAAYLMTCFVLFLQQSVLGQAYETVYNFEDARAADLARTTNIGISPTGLTAGVDGNFYGMTTYGGENGFGTIFKMTPAGILTTLVSFNNGSEINRGKNPQYQLVLGADGNFYGSTAGGGLPGTVDFELGTAFRVTPSGSLTTIHLFSNDFTIDGSRAASSFIQGFDGLFYASSENGGPFKMTYNGAISTLVPSEISGLYQQSKLMQASSGSFYGTFADRIFRMNAPGENSVADYMTLIEFTGSIGEIKGTDPSAPLIQGSDGSFYGTTRYGGLNEEHSSGIVGFGTVFKLTPQGEFTTLVEFTGNGLNFRGSSPSDALTEAPNGYFYGTTAHGGASNNGTIFRISATGTFNTLVEFTGASGDRRGIEPKGKLVFGSDGNFYGTTAGGGLYGSGTAFKITPGGEFTTLVDFKGQSTISSIGAGPIGGVLDDSEGNLFGTTIAGGPGGGGTVYKLSPQGYISNLAAFQSAPGSLGGSTIVHGLALDADGNFLGATRHGGANNFGTIFKVAPLGGLTTLLDFTGDGLVNKGNVSSGSFLDGGDGYFYGTTAYGGPLNKGTIFKVTPTGNLSTLVNFTGDGVFNRGSNPTGALVRGGDGSFYGITEQGGINENGTIFRVTPEGDLTTLVEFSGNGASNKGARPRFLEKGSDGFFYGTTTSGGSQNQGTFYKVSPSGELTTLSQGLYPFTLASSGDFYGFGASSYNNMSLVKMTMTGSFSTIVESIPFTAYPNGDLNFGRDGNLYWTSNDSICRVVFPGSPLVAVLGAETFNNAVAITAKVNARGANSSVTLEYGTDGLVFPFSIPISLLNGYQTTLVGTSLIGLAQGTTYSYRIRSTNTHGTTISPVFTFTTLAQPLAQVSLASQITSTGARFNGVVNPRNGETSVVFQWGTDGSSFPNIVAATPGTVTGNTNVSVNVAVAGLTKGSTYYYRISATNEGGTTVSGTQSFSTLTEPVASIGTANALSTTRAQVVGSVDPKSSTVDVFFEYGTDGTTFPNSFSAVPASVSGSDPVPVSATLTGLQQGTTYFYRIRAVGPGGTGLSSPGTFSLSILSGLVQVFPDPPPSANGTVTVNFDPTTRGAWRFAGETAWRNSGVAATNLASGQRLIEFLPIAGYISPPIETLDGVSGGNLVLNRLYFETESIGSGGLTVHLKPEELAAPGVPEANRAQWRFVGESQWREGDGPPVSSLTAGTYLVECKPVSGKVTPPTASVTIANGSSSELTLTYFTANNTGAATPSPLPFSSVSADEDLPFAHVGQIRSEVGSSTGFVVKRRVVATAGHVVFDDGSLSYVKSMEWLFQRHSGQFEPKPQVPRGSYLATGYATQRIADNSPGQGSPQSQTLDYAALYFLEEAGRGGYGGFLATDAGDDNEFLTSTSQKILAGYAVDGIPAADKGKLHATAAFTTALTPASGETWISTAVRGYGGCSGGPLFVQRPNGLYLPAAIYLGGNGQTVVRAIDSAVVDLFLRAEVSGNGGDNNTGGGITLASFTSFGSATQPGALEVIIQPASARAAGAGWRLKPETSYRSSGSQKSGLSAGNYQLQLSTVSGFQNPAQQTVTVNGGQLQQITFTYAAANAAPTIANVTNLTIDEDTSTDPLSVTLDDPDGPDNALVLTGTSSNSSLVPNGNIVFTGSGGSRSVTVTPATNQNGSATITLTVSDGDLTDTDTFVVTVTPVNDPPTITNISSQSTSVNTSTGAIPFTIGDIETAATSLTFTRGTSNSTLIPLSGIVFDGSGASRNVTITPAANQLGTATITVTLSDGSLTANRTFTLTVTGTARETWRFANFGTTASIDTSADTFDADGDGVTNQDEYAAGTKPNSTADFFKILTSTKTATTFTVTAAGKASRSYILERRASLATGTWNTVTSVGPLASDGPLILTDSSMPVSTGFYRIRVYLP